MAPASSSTRLLRAAIAAAACAASANGAAFTPGNILVTRVGDGTTTLSSTATSVALLEIDAATGATVQTIPLNAGGVATGTTLTGGCVVGGSFTMEGMGSLSSDLKYYAMPCYAADVGQIVPPDNVAPRTIVRVGPDGVPDYSTVMAGTLTNNLRAVATVDGSKYWFSTDVGVKYLPHGAQNSAPVSVSGSSSARGLTIANGGALYAAVGSSPYGVARVAASPLPTVAATTSLTANLVAGLGGGIFSIFSSVWQNNETVYVTSTSNGVAFHKFVWSVASGRFVNATGYPKASLTFVNATGASVTVQSFRSLSGYTDPTTGVFNMVGAIGGFPGNYIVRWNPATETWSHVTRAGPGVYDYRSVAFVPFIPPSQTPSATGTQTPTVTASNTQTPSTTATISSGSSPSATTTGTPSPSGTGTPSNTPSPTASVTPQACATDFTTRRVAAAGTSLLALRLGAGTVALSTGAPYYREFFIDEVDIATGARLQTIAVPADPALGGCVTQQNFLTDSYIARTGDGLAVLVPCWGLGNNFPMTTATSGIASVPKVILRVNASGGVSVAATFIDSATVFRSVQGSTAEPGAGATLYPFTSTGVRVVTVGAVNGTSTGVTSSGSYRGSALFNGGLYGVFAGSTGVVAVPDPSVTGQTPAYMAGITSAAGFTSTMSSLAFADATTLYLADYSGAIQKWTLDTNTATWSQAYALPATFNVTYGGATVTLTGARSIVGYTDSVTGRFSLAFTTNFRAPYAAGANFIATFDTVAQTFAAVTQACGQTEYKSVALAPIAPTPSNTPTPAATPSNTASNTPSNSATSTASATFGVTASSTMSRSLTASVSATASLTSSPSLTASPTSSLTATPTPSPSKLCSTPTAAAPFTPGSVLAIRVGDGRAALQTTTVGREVFVDEYDLVSGARIQSIALPTGPAAYAADGTPLATTGCTLNAGVVTDGLPGRAADGSFVAVACYAVPIGGTISSGTAGTKVIYRLFPDGTFAPHTVFTSGATQVRSVATADGTWYWLGSSFGALAVRGGLNATATIEVSTNANSYRGVALLAGGLYAANANTASSYQVHLIGGTTAVNVAPIASPAPAPTPLPGLATLVHTATSVVFADGGLTMWVVDSGSGPNTITKYTRPTTALASNWVRSAGYPKWGFNTTVGDQIAAGGRGAVGWTDPSTGNYVIVAATAAGLLKYDTVTEVAALVAPACDNTQLRGLVFAPVAPSPSITPSGTPSQTASLTASRTASGTPPPSATASTSFGTSPSGSLTASPTASVTATPSASPSNLCSTPNPSATPLSAGSVLAIRIGSGRTPLAATSVAREVYIDELNPATGERIQAIGPLPDGAPVFNPATGALVSAGCTLNSQFVTDGYATRSGDGFTVVLGCYATTIGTTISSAIPKHVVSVHSDGSVRSRGLWTSGAGQVRSVVTADGSAYWAGSSLGAEYFVPSTTNVTPAATVIASTASYSFRGVALLSGGLYAANSGSTTLSAVNLIGGTAAVNAAPTSSPAPAPASLPGVAVGLTSTASLVFEDALTLWTIDFSALTSALVKYTRADTAVATSWVRADGYPKWGFNGTDPADSSATVVLASGGRGSAGWTDPSTGNFVLLIATSGGIVKFDTVTETAALLRAPCDNTRYNGIALAPLPPSPTPTNTPSPSASASFNPSPSETATLTASPSTTGTASLTPSATPSPTPQPCSPLTATAVSFTPGSLVTLRVGAGLAVLQGTNTAVREAFLDEFDLSTGARLQSIPLPTGAYNAATGAASCVVSAGSTTEGHIWRTADGGALLIPCWSLPVDPGITYNSTLRKVVGVVRPTGALDTSTSWTDGANTFRSVVSADTSYFYLGTSLGIRGVAYGSAGPNATSAALSNTAQSFRGLTLFGGAIYGASIARSAAVTVAGLNQNSSGAAISVLPGMAGTDGTINGLHFENATTLWTTSFTPNSAGGSSLLRYTLAGGYWNVTASLSFWTFSWNGAPVNTTGGRGIVSYVDAATGHFTLVTATGVVPGTTSNFLVKYNTVTGAVTPLAQSCMFTEFKGVAFAPVAPSASATPSATGSVPPTPSGTPSSSATRSVTPTPSGTPSPTNTPTQTRSGSTTKTASISATKSTSGSVSVTASPPPSVTASPTRSSSRSNTPSPSRSGTASVSATPSETASVSSSGSGTASISASQTGTPSSSGSATPAETQSQTGTPSSSGSGTPAATGTGTPSRSRTPAASVTATKSRQPSASKTKTRSASPTATRTKTRTASATKTRTKTKTKTPSKKKLMMA